MSDGEHFEGLEKCANTAAEAGRPVWPAVEEAAVDLVIDQSAYFEVSSGLLGEAALFAAGSNSAWSQM